MNITNIFSSRDLDNISGYVAVILKKNPLKKLFKKTGFNSQTYTIILISFESCGNIGFKMEELLVVLIKYQQHFTQKPAKCNVYRWKFQTEGSVPKQTTPEQYHLQ